MLIQGFRQATQEQTKDSSGYGKGQGCYQEEGQIDDSLCLVYVGDGGTLVLVGMGFVFVHLHSHWLSISCIGS